MLCATDEFEGGSFQTLESDGLLKAHIFERGDVQIFLSHKYHCVEPLWRRKSVYLCDHLIMTQVRRRKLVVRRICRKKVE